jgi:hypothetical protein
MRTDHVSTIDDALDHIAIEKIAVPLGIARQVWHFDAKRFRYRAIASPGFAVTRRAVALIQLLAGSTDIVGCKDVAGAARKHDRDEASDESLIHCESLNWQCWTNSPNR